MKSLAAWAALVAATLVVAGPAAAQVRGLPVYNAGVPTGIRLGADLGFPNADAGKGLGYGVSGSIGLGPLGATATIAGFNPDGPAGAHSAVGGTVNYRLVGGPLIPLAVTLQGGVGHTKPVASGVTVTELHVPVGIGFALTIPNPALSIKPWIAPRVDVLRRKTSIEGDPIETTDTETEFAVSGGIELNLLNGLGLHAAYDLTTGGPGNPGVFGIGMHYALRVPGL